MELYERIRGYMDDHDIKQKELAARVELAPSTLNTYMTGKHRFPCDVIAKISKEFHITTDYLYGLTNDPNPPMELRKVERELVESFRTLTREQRELIVQNILFMQGQNRRP